MTSMLARFHLVDFSSGLVIAFVLATLIGAEQQWRQRSPGLGANVLIAVVAAAFVSLGGNLNGEAGAGQIGAYLVSGVGFLGAGVIIKDGAQIRGLNTAATLWCSAAVGALSGVGLLAEAFVLTLVVLAGNTLLRPLVNAINRAPLDETAIEATYQIRVVTSPDAVVAVRDLIDAALEEANFPIQKVEIEERSPKASEIVVTLVSASAVDSELNAVCVQLESLPETVFAIWTLHAGETV